MTEQEQITFKTGLKAAAQAVIEQRIAGLQLSIAAAQEAANQEEKSSAGDKYETSRAMSHLEKEMHARQLAENVKELAQLHAIAVDRIYHSVTAGAFIQTASLSAFIVAGLGKQVIETSEIVFLSPGAPLAKLLQGKTAGDSFLFKGTNTVISLVF